MYEGKQIRLKGDPGRRGVCTGRIEKRANRTLLQAIFPDTTQYIPLDQIDFLDDNNENPLDLLRAGKLGSAFDLRRTLTHIRLNGKLVDLIYSMEISNTDFYAYQFKPVLKLLNSSTRGILIADEVGLGKTIEAGLIWTELKSRYDYRKLMILCPAVLREKWQYELHYRFGIEAKIVNSTETLALLKRSATSGAFFEFAIISSMQGLRPRKKSGYYGKSDSNKLVDFLEEYEYEAPLIDCLIIDEAHYLRNPESKTSKLGKQLRKVAEYALLLSATPVHLHSLDLFQLLNLLDEDTFNHPSAFDTILNANEPLLKVRDTLVTRKITQTEFLGLVENAKQHPLLSQNRQMNAFIQSPPTDEELADNTKRGYFADRFDTINILGHVVNRTRKREVTEWRVLRDPISEKIKLTPVERRFYDLVTNTVREFCLRSNYFESFMLVTPQRQMSSSMAAALREWQKCKDKFINESIYEDLGEIFDSNNEIGPLKAELIAKVNTFGKYEELYQNDSKFSRLSCILKDLLKSNPSEKIILFSYFRSTIDYLAERLEAIGIKVLVLKGGEKIDKNEVIALFRESNEFRILLSTEVGSEGIDLQFCRFMINYDLPWNPMRVEQRIGRIDRLGQKAEKVIIWNLFYQDTIDSRIYSRLFERLKIFEKSLGLLEPVIGEEIRKLTIDLFSKKLTPEQEEERIDQIGIAIANRQRHEEQLEQEAAHLVAYGDYILNRIKAAKDLNRWISGNDLKNYVIDFIKLFYTGSEIKPLIPTENIYEIGLTDRAKHDLEYFIRDKKLNISTKLIQISPGPVKCRFENKLFLDDNSKFELVNQIHPIVRFITYQIENQMNYSHPAVSVSLNDTTFKKGTYVFTIQKWTVEALQDIEKLYYSAFQIEPCLCSISEEEVEKLVLSAALNGEPWYEARNQVDLNKIVYYANEKCLAKSDEQFEKFRSDFQNINNDRADVQISTLKNHLSKQKEIKLNVMRNHELAGRSSLAKATEGQIKTLKGRVNRKIMQIEEKRNIKIRKDEICIGLIKVQ